MSIIKYIASYSPLLIGLLLVYLADRGIVSKKINAHVVVCALAIVYGSSLIFSFVR